MITKARPFTSEDISLLVDYWVSSSDQHLKGMGVDVSKIPGKITLKESLFHAIKNNHSYCIIWELNTVVIGHTNANNFKEQQANIHLHLWSPKNRQSGLGQELLKKSLPLYFKNLNIETLICEPYAHNPASNKLLNKVGFKFLKTYTLSLIHI